MRYRPFAEYIIYDGVNLADHFDINLVDVDPMPGLSATTKKVPGSPGERFCSMDIGTRSITMDMSVKGYDRDPLHLSRKWRRVGKYLLKNEPKPLMLEDGREIYALPLSTSELQRLGTRGTSTVTFTAFDPFFYGQERSVSLKSGKNTIYIQGDYEIYPTIELSGVSGAVSVTNYLTGEQVRIPSILNAASKVVIDCNTMKCTINGNYLAVDLNVTTFFSLSPGENDIRLSGGTGTLKYREVTI